MKAKRILVTGCGGDIGFGIGRILKSVNDFDYLLGCDISDDHAGSAVFDKCVLVERASSAGYLDSLKKVVKDYGIDIVVPTSEPELRFIAGKHLENVDGVPFLMVNHKALDIGFDKYKTAKFLEDMQLPFPWTIMVSDGGPKELPCILKDPMGCGGKSVYIADKNNVDYLSKNKNDHMWQELLLPDTQEYTCGVYRSLAGDVRIIIFKRTLKDGVTVKAETVHNSDIDIMLNKLADGLGLRGSMNVQLRVTSRGPVIFEINPRFSSTVVFRHKLGFCDLLWSIAEAKGERLRDYFSVKPGVKIYRVFEEIIIKE